MYLMLEGNTVCYQVTRNLQLEPKDYLNDSIPPTELGHNPIHLPTNLFGSGFGLTQPV